MVDVSPRGARLELTTALNPRSEFSISLPLSDRIVRIRARVVHCRLTGLSTGGRGGQPIYRAGVEFLDVDSTLEASIKLAFPSVFQTPPRTGPIKVKVNVDALAQAVEHGEHGAN